jgi:Zn finger protein HypA/HybF involved in hydrogenase expression
MTIATYIQALNDLISDGEPALIRCTFCGGSGESHSAERDLCCPACDGTGKRPANWRELIGEDDDVRPLPE